MTTGRLDTRFSGPHLDPLSKESDYDPQSASISSAYVSAFNDYVRKDLKFGENRTYKPEIDVDKYWKLQAHAAGIADSAAAGAQCDARPGRGDEIQSQPQGDAEHGLLRSRDAVLRRHLRDETPADSARTSRTISASASTNRATWSMRTKRR
jgi:hypothetical protein